MRPQGSKGKKKEHFSQVLQTTGSSTLGLACKRFARDCFGEQELWGMREAGLDTAATEALADNPGSSRVGTTLKGGPN